LGKVSGFRYSFGLFVVFSACAPPTVGDFHREGEAAAKALTEEMRKIQSQDDLRVAIPKLRKNYIRLARLAIAVKDLKESGAEPLMPSQANDELFAEISRLYELPGGKDLLIAAERDALKLLK
jgi:hypothetical protein